MLLEPLSRASHEGRKEHHDMTPKQIKLVQTTWAQVVPIEGHAAAIFYNRLFTTDPKLQALFKGDMGEQKRKLMTMIGIAVTGLTRLDALVPAVRDLGRRHAEYGVQGRDYETVGSALLWTLAQGLGRDFTPEVKEAWTAAYSIIATTMQQGAAAAAA
jgi:hemoglobin-like flavoprotein